MKKPPDDEIKDSFKAVKMTLNTICSNDLLKKRINEFVLNANKIMFESYCLANLHIIKLVNQKKHIPILNQDFFQHCSQMVSFQYKRKNNVPNDLELHDTFNSYNSCRPNGFQPGFRDNFGAIINYISKDMYISTTNHLVLNFYNRLRKYITTKYDLTGEQTYKIIKEIYSDEKYVGCNIIIKKWKDKLNNIPPTALNVKKNPSFIIYSYNEILNYFNKHNSDPKNKEVRVFSLLPNKNSFTMSNITIDKTVLKDIIMSFEKNEIDDEKIRYIYNQKQNERNKDTINDSKLHWKQLFQIKNINSFSGMIKTDGNSVSILYEKERKIKQKKSKNLKGISSSEDKDYDVSNINLNDFESISAYDPGFRNMCVGTNSYEKQENDIIECSSRNYYHDCKINTSNQKKKIIYKKNTFITDFFKEMPSRKTNSMNSYIEYITYALTGLTKCLKFHLEKPFRKLKFTTYIYKQKTINELCKKITGKNNINDPKRVLVGFGNWSSQKDSIIRGHRRGPVVALKRELKRWCTLKLVDEYRTSKMCCRCDNETEKVSYGKVKVNSVLRCKNNECGIVIDRDVNGCKNIFKIFKCALDGKPRPKAYCREKIQPKEKSRETVKVGITKELAV
jgi:hypothetical protein